MVTIIRYIILLFCILLMKSAAAQPCYKFGQTPSLAIPVCDITDFIQDSVSICQGAIVPVPPCPNGTTYSNQNPFWYKFHCFASGSLGFLIIPKQITDDYDWQLFDVTGHKTTDVNTDPSLFVACNWSGVPGITGTIPNTTAVNSCNSPVSGPGVTPNQTAQPKIIKDHDYLLLISHYSEFQYGYHIRFTGGTAVISDTSAPRVKQTIAHCDGTTINIVLGSSMVCNTLALNGSDFKLSPPVATVISASSNCKGGYEFDSVTLTLSKPLPPGNYNVIIQQGNDNNTLQDICFNSIPVGTVLPVSVFPLTETPLDSVSPLNCNPNSIELTFRRPIKCGSIAPDGSDFTITGPTPVTITGATGNCNATNVSSTIKLNIKQAIFMGGYYTVSLKKGTDGNTIIDECDFVTTPQSKTFYVKQGISARFTSQIKYNCKIADTVYYLHDGNNNTSSWVWTFDDGTMSSLQYPKPLVYNYSGVRYAHLRVANKDCIDSFTQPFIVTLANYKANFEATEYVCPVEFASFINTSVGNIAGYNWSFGNGNSSVLQTPPVQSYLAVGSTKEYTAQLIIEDTTAGLICFDTAYKKIMAVPGCLITVPSAFTPNGDGLNDFLYPLNAYKAKNLSFKVYNKYGQEVFSTSDWTVKWDGTVNGQKQNPGTYLWTLQYTDNNTGKPVAQKGSVVLIR